MAALSVFSLAQEIRDEIYHYALVSPSDLLIFNTTPNPVSCCCDTLLRHNVGPSFYGADQRETFGKQLPDGLRTCDTQELPRRRACSLNLPQGTPDYADFYQWHPNVAMLRACKQLHREALPILYSQNRFCFDDRMLLIFRKVHSETKFLPGPSFMSAPAICFDFLMSLPEPILHFIRKIKFHTDPYHWEHRRLFEFVAQKTKVDDVELAFATQQTWHVPWRSNVTTLPWTSGYNNTKDIDIQKDVMNIYSLCQLTNLRRLAITMVSGFKFWGPVLIDERDGQIDLHANLIRLFRSKMLCKEAFQKVPEPVFVTTSMLSHQPTTFGAINQTIDHVHCDVADDGPTSNPPPSSSTSAASRGQENSSGHLVYESTCPICHQIGSMQYDIRGNPSQIAGKHPFAVAERNMCTGLKIESWPQDLDAEQFCRLVTDWDSAASG
jgi:hypothetical protein